MTNDSNEIYYKNIDYYSVMEPAKTILCCDYDEQKADI